MLRLLYPRLISPLKLPQPIEGVEDYNPAFDVTPGELVTAFITEQGVYQAKDLAKLARS